MNKPTWIKRLQEKWNLKNTTQVIIVLIVFSCTGFTVLFLKKPILHFLAGSHGDTVMASILYYLFILPVYNIILLFYGFVFGQFNFFWQFEKRFVNRIFSRKQHRNKYEK